jgi:hypothetical protein
VDTKSPTGLLPQLQHRPRITLIHPLDIFIATTKTKESEMTNKQYSQIECSIFYHDDGRDSLADVVISFDNDTHKADNFFYYMNKEELGLLLKAQEEMRDTFSIAGCEWGIDLCEDYEMVSFIPTGVSI